MTISPRRPTPQEALDAFHARRQESARVISGERRMIMLRLAGWSVQAVKSRNDGVVTAYESSLRPEGLDYPLTNKRSGRRYGQKPKPDPARFRPIPFE